MKHKICFCLLISFVFLSCSSNVKIHRKYYDNGQLKWEFRDLKKSKKSGREKTWYKDGSFKGFENYEDGQKHGFAIAYHLNGRILVISRWNRGKLQGDVKFYREDGTIEYCLVYKKGKVQEQKWYDKKGNLSFYEKFNRKKGVSTVSRYNKGVIVSKKEISIDIDANEAGKVTSPDR